MAVSTNLPDHSLCPLFNSTVRLTDLSSFVSTFCQVSQHWPVPSLLFPFSSLQWSFFCWGSSADRHTMTHRWTSNSLLCALPFDVFFFFCFFLLSSTLSAAIDQSERKKMRIFSYTSQFFPPVNHTINCAWLFFRRTTCVSQFVKQKKDAATFFRCWLSPLFSFFCLYHRFFFGNLSVFKPLEDVDHSLMRSIRCVLLCLFLSVCLIICCLLCTSLSVWNGM